MPNITADMQFEPAQLEQYLQYHTIEQAMEDVAAFARQFSFDGLPAVDLKPGTTPWVFVGKYLSRTTCQDTDFPGGSYPGARSAWMRARNPEIFHASLASSAVVELQENFWQYYRVIENTMADTGYANCSSDMRALAAYLDNAFDTQNATAVDSFLLGITGPKGSPLYRYFHYDDLTGASNAWDNRRTNLRAAIEVMFQDFQVRVKLWWVVRLLTDLSMSAWMDTLGRSAMGYRLKLTGGTNSRLCNLLMGFLRTMILGRRWLCMLMFSRLSGGMC